MARKKKFFIDAYWPREPKASGRDEDCLWFHAGKKYRVHEGDRVLLLETKRHPDHDDWRGSGKVFQSATATAERIKVLDLPKVGGQLWDYKVPLKIEIRVDRDKGIEWEKVRGILGWQPGATLRNPPQRITESQFLEIEGELRKFIGNYDEGKARIDKLIEKEKSNGSNLKQSQILTNDEIREYFSCGLQGGMRRSLKTNSLVLISDHTRGIYKDRWEDNILHYTGMGLKGNQSLSVAQNKTLLESSKSGINLFLFEVFESGKYIYQGKVKLVGSPYKEKQPDEDGNMRDVWIFPLQLIGHGNPALIPEETFRRKQAISEKQATKLSLDELRDRIERTSKTLGVRNVISKQYDRNSDVAEFVKRKAGGMCDLCENEAPFKDKSGRPYLETHHIEWLSRGGEDSIENTVGICPNCHRKMHILDSKKDKDFLREKALKRT
jgi:5-methylcytosine-specific restriction protein A